MFYFFLFKRIRSTLLLEKFFATRMILCFSPGLVVMGGDSCSEGRGLESQRRILDGHKKFHIYLL